MTKTPTERRYSKEELSQRGDALYERTVRPRLKADDDGKFAAIDIESGKFEVNQDEMKACDALRAQAPRAQIWLVRIGSPYVHRFGGREQLELR
jgi:hypothetical protein